MPGSTVSRGAALDTQQHQQRWAGGHQVAGHGAVQLQAGSGQLQAAAIAVGQRQAVGGQRRQHARPTDQVHPRARRLQAAPSHPPMLPAPIASTGPGTAGAGLAGAAVGDTGRDGKGVTG